MRSSGINLWLLIALILSFLWHGQSFANVVPPLETAIELPEKGFAADSDTVLTLSVMVPNTGNNQEASIKLALTATGVAKIAGPTEWAIDKFDFNKTQTVTTTVRVEGYGEGEFHLQAQTFSSDGSELWGRADAVFILRTTDEILSGKSSDFELRRQKIEAESAQRERNRYSKSMTEEYSQKTLLKNWAFCICLASVSKDKDTIDDANATASAYLEYGKQPIEAYNMLRKLSEQYARRQYVGSIKSEFNTMKCIDLLHSKELDKLVNELKG